MKTQTQFHPCLLAMIASAATLVSSALAVPTVSYQHSVFTGATPTLPVTGSSSTGPLEVPVVSIGDASLNASVQGQADFGRLRAVSEANTTSGNLSRADLTASWTDTYGIDSGFFGGAAAIRYVQIRLSGSGSAVEGAGWGAPGFMRSGFLFSLNESSSAGAELTYNGTWTSLDGGGGDSFSSVLNGALDLSGSVNEVDRVFEIAVPFILGIPFSETVSLTTFARGFAAATAPGSGNGAAEADLSNTLEWLGIRAVTLLDGTPVTDYTVFSESGTDWSKPYGATSSVPDGGSSALLLLPALASLAWMRLRRPRSA